MFAGAQDCLVRVSLSRREKTDVAGLQSHLAVPHTKREGACQHVKGVASGAPILFLEPRGELQQAKLLRSADESLESDTRCGRLPRQLIKTNENIHRHLFRCSPSSFDPQP